MGGHHKKNLRAEKAKVKLKGAKLPKGLNVTKTEFKVRKITLRTQLKEQEFVEGQRQVNLKETLTRLKHHSSTFRLESLRSLRDAIANAHMGIRGHLGDIVQSVAAVCLDIDKTTRRECFKTLSCLLDAVPIEAITPFFHIISSYLRCAMTHIQPALQDDALLMLDVLLQHVPHLVAAHSSKILHNFLEMISRVRAEGERTERTLTVHLGQQQTTVKWRAKVLQRLQHMLQTFAEHKLKESAVDDGKSNLQMYTFNGRSQQYFPLKRSYSSSQACNLSTIFNRSVGFIAENAATTADETKLLRGYVEHLMPLLLEAWLEVRPQAAAVNAHQVLLSTDAAQTLQTVLEIIENLWTLIELHEKVSHQNDLSMWFQLQYAERFVSNFVQTTAYPYQQSACALNAGMKKGKKLKGQTKGTTDEYCLQQNVSVAFLLCRFNSIALQSKSTLLPFKAPLEFLNSLLGNGVKLNALQKQNTLVLALRAYLLQNALLLLQLDETTAVKTRLLLRTTMKAFRNNAFAHKEGGSVTTKVLALLCEIAQNPQLVNAFGESEFEEFLKQLPQLLLKPTISSTALVAMSNLGKQKISTFLDALAHIAPAVIENLQKIQVQGASNALVGKRHIMNLLYWMDKPEGSAREERQEILMNMVAQHVTDKRLVSYLHFILI